MSCPNGMEGNSSSCILPSPTPSPLPSPSSTNGSHLFIYYIIYAAVIFYGATAIFRCFTRKNRLTPAANFILNFPFWIIVYLIGVPVVFVVDLFKIIFKSNPSRTPSTTNVIGGDDKKEEITVTTVTGVDQSIITILPTLTYKGNDGEKCQICSKKVKDGEVKKFLPSCLHIFHVDCIIKWLKSNVRCPICQVKVNLPPAVAVIDIEEVLEPSTRSDNGGLGSANVEESQNYDRVQFANRLNVLL